MSASATHSRRVFESVGLFRVPSEFGSFLAVSSWGVIQLARRPHPASAQKHRLRIVGHAFIGLGHFEKVLLGSEATEGFSENPDFLRSGTPAAHVTQGIVHGTLIRPESELEPHPNRFDKVYDVNN